MPGFDGTGPLGQGPMTGRGMGYCVLKTPEGNSIPPAFEQNVLAHRGQEAGAFRAAGKEVITMPAGNGTGPLGMGPMTGRAAGYCAGYPAPGYMNPIPGRGFWGRGFIPGYGATPYGQTVVPYGYVAGYAPGWGRAFGWFGRGFGRGWGRGFGRGRGRGRW